MRTVRDSRRAIVAVCLTAAFLAATSALANGSAFPWDGAVTLRTKDGKTLSWTVRAEGAEVSVTGTHAKWSVEHRARADGTPISTVKTSGKRTTRVAYRPNGATYASNDGKTKSEKQIPVAGLWDGDTLDARLAGIEWAPGKKVKFKVIDTDSADGDVYPMVAECLGLEKCASGPCHHVRVSLDDFRRYFAPSWSFRYGTGPGAPYLQHVSADETFDAP